MDDTILVRLHIYIESGPGVHKHVTGLKLYIIDEVQTDVWISSDYVNAVMIYNSSEGTRDNCHGHRFTQIIQPQITKENET